MYDETFLPLVQIICTYIYVDMDINVNILKCFLNDLISISVTQLANKKEIFRNKSFVISYCY